MMVLSKGGITMEDGLNMTAQERLAWSLALGQMHGMKFNEITGQFENPDVKKTPQILRA
jgi:hypothetical protein